MGIVFSTNIQNNKKRFLSQYLYLVFGIICRIIAISNKSHLEAHSGIYRLLMKGILDAYVLRPFDKKLIYELVTRVNTRNFTVCKAENIVERLEWEVQFEFQFE